MKAFVIKLIKDNLPDYYYYHSWEHTLYVIEKAIEIGKHENCTEEEIKLLAAAALWHDTGLINMYAGHEEESCRLARIYLPDYGFSAEEIDIICGMIMATRLPQSPQNKLEEIIADADLEYLGTANVEKKAENLYRELKTINPDFTKEQWDQVQISFLLYHKYFTRFCKENMEPSKSVYLKKLQQHNNGM